VPDCANERPTPFRKHRGAIDGGVARGGGENAAVGHVDHREVPATASGERTIVTLYPVCEQALTLESAIVTWRAPPATVATATTAGLKGTHKPVTDPLPREDGALEWGPLSASTGRPESAVGFVLASMFAVASMAVDAWLSVEASVEASPAGRRRAGGARRRGACVLWQSAFMTDGIKWAPEAEARMKKVPFFVRPLARRKAEAAARDRGMPEVTSALLDEIKAKEMPGG
jgi:hypothetical protein